LLLRCGPRRAALFRLGRVAEGIAQIREALQFDPSDSPARINLDNALGAIVAPSSW